MEARGGNGYIEEWANARLVRDAHIGVLWEGTSNIIALDIVTRAIGKSRAHRTLEIALTKCSMKQARSRRLSGSPAQTLDRTLVWPSASQPNPRWKRTRGEAASALLPRPSAPS